MIKYYDVSGYAIPRGSSQPAQPTPGQSFQFRSAYDIIEYYSTHPDKLSPAVMLGAVKDQAGSQEKGKSLLLRPAVSRRARRDFLSRGNIRRRIGKILLGADRILSWPYRKVSAAGWDLAEKLKEKGDKAWQQGVKGKIKGELFYIGAGFAAAGTGFASALTGLIAPEAYVDTGRALAHPIRTLKEIGSNPLAWDAIVGGAVAGKIVGDVVAAGRARVYEPDLHSLSKADVGVFGRVMWRRGVGLEHDWVARLDAEGVMRPVGPRGGPFRSRAYGPFVHAEGSDFIVEWRRPGRVVRFFRRTLDGKKVVGREEWVFKRGKFILKGFYKDPELIPEQLDRVKLRNPGEVLRRVVAKPPPRLYMYNGLWPALGAGLGGVLGAASWPASSTRVREGGRGNSASPSLTTKGSAGGSSIEIGGFGRGAQSSMVRELAGSGSRSSSLTRGAVGALSLPASSGSGSLRVRLPRASGSGVVKKRRRRRRKYNEILYPHAVLPI